MKRLNVLLIFLIILGICPFVSAAGFGYDTGGGAGGIQRIYVSNATLNVNDSNFSTNETAFLSRAYNFLFISISSPEKGTNP